MATRFNVVVPKKYEKDGVEKTSWRTIGTLVQFPKKGEDQHDGFILELDMFPQTTFKVFPPREDAPKKSEDW